MKSPPKATSSSSTSTDAPNANAGQSDTTGALISKGAKSTNRVSLSPGSHAYLPVNETPPRKVKKLKPNTPPIYDLTDLPDSPIKPLFDIAKGDVVVYFPGICWNWIDMDWTIVRSVTNEMTVIFGGMVMIGEYTKCYVLRPCEENFLSPMPYGPKYFHQLTPNKSKSKRKSSPHCLSAGEILQDHIVNAESRSPDASMPRVSDWLNLPQANHDGRKYHTQVDVFVRNFIKQLRQKYDSK